jgi:phosphoserine phosphatase
VLPERGTEFPPMTQRGTRLPPMTRPSTRDLRARSVLAGEASAATAELDAVLETPPVSRTAACWLVTASPLEPARLLTGRLGLTGALGGVAAERDGVYTGELDSRLRRHAGNGRPAHT